MSLDACCRTEAGRSLRADRDVAICDGCGRLLLAWTAEAQQIKTREELERNGVAFAEGRVGELYVTAKARG